MGIVSSSEIDEEGDSQPKGEPSQETEQPEPEEALEVKEGILQEQVDNQQQPDVDITGSAVAQAEVAQKQPTTYEAWTTTIASFVPDMRRGGSRKKEEKIKAEEERRREEEWRKQMEKARKIKEEEEEETRKWTEKFNSLEADHHQIQDGYAQTSKILSDESSAELKRIADETKRSKELFEQAMKAEIDARQRAFEESRKMKREQMNNLFMLMRKRRWSEQIKSQLSAGLLLLRSAHDPVHIRFNRLTVYIGNQTPSSDHYLLIRKELTLLTNELSAEVTTMNDQVVELVRFQSENKKAKFLLDIENSARNVAHAASELLSEIEQAEVELSTGDARSISVEQLNKCQLSFEELEKSVYVIPTVADLKKKYRLY